MTRGLDETVVQRIAEYRLWLDELKAAQRVGAASLLVVSNKSAAAVDQGVTIAAAGQTSLAVTFTATTQDYALAALDLVFYTDSGGTAVVIPPVRVEERLVPASNPRATTWQVTVDNPDDLSAVTYYIKRVVNATDAGVIFMIDDLDDIVRTVRQLRLDLNELKNAQRVGYDSLLTYKTATSDLYDMAVALTTGPSKDFLITLNHAEAKGGALIELNAFYRANNPNVMANPVARNVQSNNVSWMKVASNPTSTVWRLRVYNAFYTGGYTAYVKLFFDGTDTGTCAVQAL